MVSLDKVNNSGYGLEVFTASVLPVCCPCLFLCHAENQLKLWCSCNHPLCSFSFLYLIYVFRLLHCSPDWFSMQPYLFLVLAQWWCDKKDWGGNPAKGFRRCSSQPCCWGERGLGRQCFQFETGQKHWYVLPRRASLFEEVISWYQGFSSITWYKSFSGPRIRIFHFSNAACPGVSVRSLISECIQGK